MSLVTARRDEDGELLLDEDGELLLEVTRGRAHARLAAIVRARRFLSERAYLFAVLEGERDEPIGIARRQRTGGGLGYKLWKSREDFLAAELGLGDKRLDYTDGSRRRGAIGYAALRLVRRLGERVRLNGALDVDFAGDDPYAALRLGAGLRVSERVLLKLRREERYNTREPDPRDPLDSRRDSLTTLSLEVVLF